ncbi:LytR/AlgR family response regulator transcription factor [Roseivirga misakiensis]|uniref:DNA-binding response regulator n=1 Tax=Roseivirga misakiensis TaxID=1563681 RepID=A0A1E5SZ37_9BACT|nr:LytTR family DNA-binding domain-containing protein [Roseivirga misakiensis]OEK04393.1 DNA-binding response regulator [Roseivirga misakiensis]
MINYLIIDDEPIAHRIIEGYADHLSILMKLGNCYNAMEAISALNSTAVDLIFLDINMPQLSGFEMLKTLSKRPRVIVTTAYQEFALEGYELEVVDYLLKPFSLERFIKAINKLTLTQTSAPPMPANNAVNESIYLKEDRRFRQVWLDDILYVEAYGNYCKVYLKNELLITPEKISDLEKTLPSTTFLRTHKSYIVAKNHINAIEGNKINIVGKFIPIGQTYMRTIKNLLKG